MLCGFKVTSSKNWGYVLRYILEQEVLRILN